MVFKQVRSRPTVRTGGFKQVAPPKARYVAPKQVKGPGGFSVAEKGHWATPNGSWVAGPPGGGFTQLHPIAAAVHQLLTGGYKQVKPKPSSSGYSQVNPRAELAHAMAVAPPPNLMQLPGNMAPGAANQAWGSAMAGPDAPSVPGRIGPPPFTTSGAPEDITAQQAFIDWANAQMRRARGPEAY